MGPNNRTTDSRHRASYLTALLVAFAWLGAAASTSTASPLPDPYSDRRSDAVKNWRKATTVQFSDGSVVPVVFRRTPPIYGPVTDSLAHEYPALRAAFFAGNRDVAFTLWRALDGCQRAHATQLDLEAAALHFRETGVVRFADGSVRSFSIDPKSVSAVGQEIEEGLLRRPHRFCAGVTPSRKAEASQWLQRAMENDVPWAHKAHAYRLPPSAAKVEALQQSWRAGSVSALENIASVLKRGWPGSDGNRVDAYAYLDAHIAVDSAASAVMETSSSIRAERLARERGLLQVWGQELSADERSAAQKLAMELVRSNDRCCFVD
jgi:hypothetical protein